MGSIDFSTSLIYILCAALAGLYTFFLYRGKKTQLELSGSLFYPLLALRFAGIALLLLLILDPLIKAVEQVTTKPVLVVGLDQSQSITLSKDSSNLQVWLNQFSKLENELSQKYDLQWVDFGNDAQLAESPVWKGTDEVSNFQVLFDFLKANYPQERLAGTVLISDGAYNRGANPLFSDHSTGSFLNTVLVGDTTVQKDIYVQSVSHNEIVFAGNAFSLNIGIGATKIEGIQPELIIYLNGKEVKRKKIQIEGTKVFKEENFIIEPKGQGIQKLEAELKTTTTEANKDNNRFVSYIEVINSQSKVLILAHAPHPDIFTIKKALAGKKQYQVESTLAKDFNQSIDAYNLIITHNLPQSNNALFNQIASSDVPAWYIIGAATNQQALNNSTAGIQILGRASSSNTVRAGYDKNFGLFKMNNGSFQDFEDLPPLVAPFGEVSINEPVNMLFQQKIGSLNSGIPMLAFGEEKKRKAWLTANGIWQWNLFEAAQKIENKLTDDLITGVAQYLVLKDNKSRLKVNSKAAYWENENIQFRAQLYNKGYEPITSSPVKLRLTSEAGKQFNFEFEPGGDKYFLDLGVLEPGEYTYEAECVESGETLTVEGQFYVKELSLETIGNDQDAKLMHQLAERNGGKTYNLDALEQLKNDLLKDTRSNALISTITKFSSIISWKWILLIVIACFSLEWLLRKRYGVN